MDEASKGIRRRGKELCDVLFSGKGIDIGAGPDCIDKFGYDAYNWDLKDGDAQFLATVKDNTYDFVHSAHCLEHMVDPRIAIKHWVRACKPGGHIVITIPDEELYEHNFWPSKFNTDHKWSFRILRKTPRHAKSLSVFDVLGVIWKEVEILSITRQEAGFNWELDKRIDQTGPVNGPECAIEIILRKL